MDAPEDESEAGDRDRGRIGEERAVGMAGPVVAGEALALDGLFRAGASPEGGGVLIAPPHPLYGGSMENPVVSELGFAAARAGLASLRFDWRGVGASSGTASGDEQHHAADYAAALEHLAETVPGPLCAAGYSAGAAAAVRVAARASRVRGLILVAPPPAMISGEALARFRGPLLVIVGDRDRVAPAGALQAMLEKHPALRLVILPGVDHFFGAGLAELSRAASDWLAALADAAD